MVQAELGLKKKAPEPRNKREGIQFIDSSRAHAPARATTSPLERARPGGWTGLYGRVPRSDSSRRNAHDPARPGDRLSFLSAVHRRRFYLRLRRPAFRTGTVLSPPPDGPTTSPRLLSCVIFVRDRRWLCWNLLVFLRKEKPACTEAQAGSPKSVYRYRSGRIAD